MIVEDNNKKNAVKTIALMMFISIIGKVLGLIREIMFAKNFGTTSTDGTAFAYASNIPNQFLDIMFASSITSSFIPVFNNRLEKKGLDEAFRLFNNFLSLIIFLASIVIILSYVFAVPIINLTAPGLDLKTKILTIKLLKILLPVLLFSGITFSMIGVLQAFGEFNIPSATSIIFNGVIIFYYIFLIKKFGVYGLAIAFTLGWLSQLLIQIPVLVKKKYKFVFKINLRDDGIREIFKLMLPVLISSWVLPINNIVNANAVSYIDGGGVALKTANMIYMILTGTFVLSVNNFVFQELSKIKASRSQIEFNSRLKSAISAMFYFLTPLMFIFMIFSREIISVLFEGGKFDSNSTDLTANALFFYALGIIGYGIQTVLSSSFYADRNGKTPLISAIVALCINFILSFWLIKFLGIGGPALASALSLNISAVFMLGIFNKKDNTFLNKKFWFDLLKISLASVTMGICIFYIHELSCFLLSFVFGHNIFQKFFSLAVTCLIGFVLYIIFTLNLKLDEAIFIKDMFSSTIKKFFNKN